MQALAAVGLLALAAVAFVLILVVIDYQGRKFLSNNHIPNREGKCSKGRSSL